MVSKIPKVCIVIPTWNHKNDVLQVLSGVEHSVHRNFELQVCIIDNGSKDGTAGTIKKEFRHAKLIVNNRNLGFVKACNLGIGWALNNGYDFIGLLNDDTLVDENLIKNILLTFKNDGLVGAVSPKIYFAKGFEYHKGYDKADLGRVIWYAGGKIDWANVYGSNRGVDEVDMGQYDKIQETDFATGCFVMFNSKALRRVGLYDERYFAYMEDVEHSMRLRKAGWKVLYNPSGVLWHKVSRSSGIGSKMNDYYLTRNRMIFGLKYAPLRTKIALIKESIKLLLNGREWQRIGIRDFYLGNFDKGSWKEE